MFDTIVGVEFSPTTELLCPNIKSRLTLLRARANFSMKVEPQMSVFKLCIARITLEVMRIRMGSKKEQCVYKFLCHSWTRKPARTRKFSNKVSIQGFAIAIVTNL